MANRLAKLEPNQRVRLPVKPLVDGLETTETECWTEVLARVQAEEETDRQAQAQARTLDALRITLDAGSRAEEQARSATVKWSECRSAVEAGAPAVG